MSRSVTARVTCWPSKLLARGTGARCAASLAPGWLHPGSVVTVAGNRTAPQPAAAAGLDPESAEWLRALCDAGPQREAALTRLHELLVRIARGEVARHGLRLRITGTIGQFRGESRFTTWACKFVIFEVSAKIGRHFWRHPGVPLDAEDWDRLPGRFGFDPAEEAEWRDLLAALHRAVDQELTARQRRVFVAIVLNSVPLDTLVIEMAANRNAIYKT